MNYEGTIIEESLENVDILKEVVILRTRVEKVTEKHKTPWLEQWTLHTIAVSENKAKKFAEKMSKAFDQSHSGSWYADFKNNIRHYIIFHDKIFCINRKNKKQYNQAKCYGLALGIPEHQVNFNPKK